MEEMPKSEFASVVEETRLLLKDNNEWRARYAVYAEKISGNLGFINSVRSSFREWSPLKVYLNTTSSKSDNGLTLVFNIEFFLVHACLRISVVNF